MIRVACIKFGGLATGGTERLLQSIAAYLPKDQFDVTFFYCDSAPYVGSDWRHPDTDPGRKAFLESHGVKLVKFKVGAKDIRHPHHVWLDTDFFDHFREEDFDIVQTARAGHAEYPFTHINKTPIVDAITLPGMAEDKKNIASVFHISKYQAISWMNAGGPLRKAVILPIFQDLKNSNEHLREDLGIPSDHFVFGFHQRDEDGIFAPYALNSYANIQSDKTHFIVLGGSKNYSDQATKLGLINFKQLPHTGDSELISKFLNTLDVFCHNRRDGETFGAVIAEALFHGLPIISHVAPAMGQVETVGPAGFICAGIEEYSQRMKLLLENEDLRKDLSAKARDHYRRNFTKESCMKTVVETYERVCKKFIVRSSRSSYESHNEEYEQSEKLEKEILLHRQNTQERAQFNPDVTLGHVLSNFDRKIGVDIGSGTGWCANLMSKTLEKVYAIEPSRAAIQIAKKIYPENEKVEWMNGFAQTRLSDISLEDPAIFNSSCVLSHLDDDIVEEICNKINQIAPVGSILAFSECHGVYFRDPDNLWHSRSQRWWSERFPGWRLFFNDFKISHPENAKKGFWAIKES